MQITLIKIFVLKITGIISANMGFLVSATHWKNKAATNTVSAV